MCKYELATSRLSKVIVRQTDKQTQPKLYTTPLCGWSKIKSYKICILLQKIRLCKMLCMMTFLENLKIFYWFLTTRGGAWHVGRVCLYNVCMQYVCLSNCQTITFERLNVENAYLHIRCQVRMKVIRSGSVGHMSKKDRH